MIIILFSKCLFCCCFFYCSFIIALVLFRKRFFKKIKVKSWTDWSASPNKNGEPGFYRYKIRKIPIIDNDSSAVFLRQWLPLKEFILVNGREISLKQWQKWFKKDLVLRHAIRFRHA